jgi:hypothetical protein
MTGIHRCLHCAEPLALEDTNVATDVALCRACGRSMPFSSVTAEDDLSAVDLTTPPRGVKVGHSLISGIEVTYRGFNPVVLFLIPFTAVWSGFSLWGIYGSQFTKGKFDFAASLAGLPFLIGTLVLLAVIANMLFGHWRLLIDRGTARIFNGVGPVGRHREIKLTADTHVRLVPSRLRVNGRERAQVQITNEGRVVHFGASLPDDVCLFLAAVLRKAVPPA